MAPVIDATGQARLAEMSKHGAQRIDGGGESLDAIVDYAPDIGEHRIIAAGKIGEAGDGVLGHGQVPIRAD